MLNQPADAWRRVRDWQAFRASLVAARPAGIGAAAPARCRLYHEPGIKLRTGDTVVRERDRLTVRVLADSRSAPAGSAIELRLAEGIVSGLMPGEAVMADD